VARGASLCASLLLGGCLVAGGVGGSRAEGNGPVADGEYIPEIPVLPAGWPALAWPADNPYTSAKAILGRRLFFEAGLSSDGTVSCSWCHGSGHAFTDMHRVAFSTGVGGVFATRNTPTTVNMIFGTSFMLDGAATTLEEQALLPLLNPHEMNMTRSGIEARLAADTLYVKLFRQAFGAGTISLPNVARALATYQRTLISYRTPYDQWVAGDSAALSEPAKRGAVIFLGEKGGCARCHVPPLFTDGRFYDIGLDSAPADSGRARVTGLAGDVGRFKTPTLRNVFHTGPYMHDGRIASLEHVVMHYNSGGAPSPNRDPGLKPLGLSESEVYDLTIFLESLTDESVLRAPQP